MPEHPYFNPPHQKNYKHLLIAALAFLGLSAITFSLCSRLPEKPTSSFSIGFLILGIMGNFFIASVIYLIATARSRANSIALQITKRLTESERKYHAIFDSFQDIYLETDTNGQIITITPSVTKILGFSEEQMLTKHLEDIIQNKETFKKFNDLLDQKGAVDDFEFEMKGAYGQDLFFSADCQQLHENGNLKGLTCIMYDITEQIKKRDAIKMRSQELERINRVLLERELKMADLKEENKKLRNQLHAT